MAVYTQLAFGEIEALVAPLGLGRLIAAQGVAAGVENSTYFLDFATASGIANTPDATDNAPAADAPVDSVRVDGAFIGAVSTATHGYVLTIAESLTRSDLEFIASLMDDLHARALPVPAPVRAGPRSESPAAGEGVLMVHGKPALLVPRIAGTHPQALTPGLCGQLGSVLAKLHLATLSLDYTHTSHRSLEWVAATGKVLLPHLAPTERDLLNREIEHLAGFVSANTNLPRTIIHGDLFPDNVLLEEGNIVALIDFFSAGMGYPLLDLAIVVNAWCHDEHGQLNTLNYNALAGSYSAIRRPEDTEIANWGALLRIAALRFWVSRLGEQLLAGPQTPRGRGKNPQPYRRLTLAHRDSPLPPPLDGKSVTEI